jgi:cytochrome c-type biogenesis protein CcmE
MGYRFFLAIFIVTVGLSTLIYSAVQTGSRAVVTVSELIKSSSPQKNIRLGARVADNNIEYETKPKFILRFNVKDVASQDANDSSYTIPVTYYGIRPDTMREGRDVILEGDFDGKQFVANSLLTQCPSKYEVPLPGETYNDELYG